MDCESYRLDNAEKLYIVIAAAPVAGGQDSADRNTFFDPSPT
jgi:hypothetical protein